MASPEGFNPYQENSQEAGDLEQRLLLIDGFKTALKQMPEFREALLNKFLPLPDIATDEQKGDVIETYFSDEPHKGFKGLVKKYFSSIPGEYDDRIIFTKDGDKYETRYNPSEGSGDLFNLLKRDKQTKTFEFISINRIMSFHVEQKDSQTKSIPGNPALEKGKQFLASLSN